MVYNDKQIGKNIKAIRNANKKSLLDFAGDIGISDSLLGKKHSVRSLTGIPVVKAVKRNE